MQTWTIQNGDLVLNGNGFATVYGAQKVQQDLEVATLTPYKSNRFHPRYGSVLYNMIGTPSGAATAQLIENEIQRIVTNYQKIQINKANASIIQGKTSPYNQNDLVQSLTNIQVTQYYDSFTISGLITTLGGQSLPITQIVSAGS